VSNNITVLIANCGTLAAGPALISMLRDNSEKNIRIIGVDLNPDNPARYLVDKFYEAPPSPSKEFIDFMYRICCKEQVDIILPTSTDRVLLSLKKNEGLFKKNNTLIPGSSYEDLIIANDKGLMLSHLKSSGLPCADFRSPTSVQEFDVSLNDLGYPGKKLVVKPRITSGSRGFRILDESCVMSYDKILGKAGLSATTMTADDYRDVISKEASFPDIILMEYLPGTDYSVYCLADKGNTSATIPMIRIKPGEGISYVSEVMLDDTIISYANDVVKQFNLSWNVNIQMKVSQSGVPLVYEINPRLAGSIILTKAAGCDLLDLGLKQLLGEDLTINTPINGTRMYRYFTEVYV